MIWMVFELSFYFSLFRLNKALNLVEIFWNNLSIAFPDNDNFETATIASVLNKYVI